MSSRAINHLFQIIAWTNMTDLNDDITRYLSGQMSAAEMHALEKKALGDPFLADALAGAESISRDEFSADVTELHDRLNRRLSDRSTVGVSGSGVEPLGRQRFLWTWPTRVAAGLFLAVSAGLAIFFISDKKVDDLAINRQVTETHETESGSVASDSLQSNTSDDSKITAATKSPDTAPLPGDKPQPQNATPPQPEENGQVPGAERELESTKENKRAQNTVENDDRRNLAGKTAGARVDDHKPAQVEVSEDVPETASDSRLPSTAQTERNTKDGYVQSDAETSKTAEFDELATKREVASNDAGTGAAVKKPTPSVIDGEDSKKSATTAADKSVFSGKVVDDDGAGIPGVNVVIKGTNTGTVTDIHGNYQLVDDSPSPTLVYTFIGYSNEEAAADPSPPTTVTLSEDLTQLSEIVVAGYGVSRTADPAESTYDFAYPFGGRRAYKQYLEKSLQYPKDALLNNVEGRVTVTFP